MTTTIAPSPAAKWWSEHQPLLEHALAAIKSREYYSAYPEVPSGKIYGENAQAEGKAALENRLGKRFELSQPGTTAWIGAEKSPFGVTIGVTYPQIDAEQLIPAVQRAQREWA
ncbi:MAG: phenylacetic acid degradation protein PaaN, partial [Vulcanimicrobiaceae bacterium]